jgi:hypothetical protein
MLRLVLLLLFAGAVLEGANSLPFHFEPNRGQAARRVRYIARVRNAAVSLTDAGFEVKSRAAGSTVEVEGASAASHWTPAEDARGTTSYYLGRSPDPRMRGIPNFGRIIRRNLYPNVDIVAYGAEGRLEYDFLLAPGADPRRIRLRFRDARRLRITWRATWRSKWPGALS